MAILVKSGGAYAAISSIKVKVAGSYAAPVGVFVKSSGAYGRVDASWSPSDLFAAAEKGVVLDPSDMTTLFQDSAGTTPVTGYGQQIGKILDKSGNAKHLTQGTSGSRPYYTDNGADMLSFHAHSMASAAIDFTSTDKITVVCALRIAHHSTIGVAIELGNILSGNGSFTVYAPVATGSWKHGQYIRGTAFAGIGQTTPNANINTDVLTCVYDISGASVTDEIKPRLNGSVLASSVVTAGPGGTGNFGNLALTLGTRGGAVACMQLGKTIIIGRQLTAEEILLAEAWVRSTEGPIIAAVGDSTVTSNTTYPSLLSYINCKARTIAVAGNTIAQQKTAWQARTDEATFAAVLVQVGLNDLAPAESAAVAIARLQDFITTINADVSVPVLISTMTPCKGQLIAIYGAVDGETAYTKWLDMNEAIKGNGATPITGVDARISSHTTDLNDGAGNLAAAYQADLIHPNYVGRMINARAWFVALQSAGVI